MSKRYVYKTREVSAGAFLKKMSVLHFVFVVGMIVFAIVAYVQNGSTEIDISNTNDPYFIAVPSAAIAGILLSMLIYKNRINALSNTASLKDKLLRYQTARIVKYLLLEVPILFGLVIYMNTGNMFYLLVSVMVLIYFFTLFPRREKIIKELNMDRQQQILFNKPDQLLN